MADGKLTSQDVQNAMSLMNQSSSLVQQARQLGQQIDNIKANLAAIEADGNRKTRTYAFLDGLADEGMSSKDLKGNLDVLDDVKEALAPLFGEEGSKKGGK